MARSVNTIQANILAAITASPVLGSLLTSTSLASIFNLFAYVIAQCQNLLEQVMDNYIAQIDAYAAQTPAASTNWIAAQGFLYQYDPSTATATNALTILGNGALGYATINPSFNIVTRCAAITNGNNTVQIKVAQGATPTQITGIAFTQLQSYFAAKGTAGINYVVTSGVADNLVLLGTVYFKSGFGGVVQANVTNALNGYLNNIAIYSPTSQEPINYAGVIKVSEIIDAIMNAEGVSDFLPTKILAYPNGVSYPSGATTVYNLSTSTNNKQYVMAAGYAIVDNANTLLTFASE